MINNITQFEIKIGDHAYRFLCESNSPLGEVHDALYHMKQIVLKKMQECHESEKAHKEDDNNG